MMLRRVKVLVLVLLLALTAGAEIRGLWVVRRSIRSPESIRTLVANAKEWGYNTLFVQVSGSGVAYYRSNHLPRMPEVASFDPLGMVLAEAQKVGIQVHAWINAYTVGPVGDPPNFGGHVLKHNPDWQTYDLQGQSLRTYRPGQADDLPAGYLDPGLPGVQRWVLDMAVEIARLYPVAGIHLDYIRYPSRNYGYHPTVLAEFVGEWGLNPQEILLGYRASTQVHGRERVVGVLAAWDDFRRGKVTDLVAEISREVKRVRPGALISAAVFPDPQSAREVQLQDWGLWLQMGILDLALPMAYQTDLGTVVSLTQKGVALGGDKILPGLAAYRLRPGELVAMIRGVAGLGAGGFVLFSYETLVETKGYGATLARLMNQ